MGKILKQRIKLICYMACGSVLLAHPVVYAQDAPPAPDIDAIFDEIAPPSDDPALIFDGEDMPAFPPLDESEADGDLFNDLPPVEGADVIDAPIVASESQPLPESATGSVLVQNDPEYNELEEALFEFLDKPAPIASAPERLPQPSNENMTDDASQNADALLSGIGENIENVSEEANSFAELEAQEMLDEILADVPSDSTPVIDVNDVNEAQSSNNAPAMTQVAPPLASESPASSVQPNTSNHPAAAPPPAQPQPSANNIAAIDDQPASPPLPALTAQEKAFINEVDRASEALPGFVQLPDAEKNALHKPLESLAREQKEAERQKNAPPERQTLERGGDLSAISNNDGDARSDLYDMSVTTKSDSQEFFSTDIQLEMAYRALLSGQLEAAIDIYKTVLAKESENQSALFGLASAYQKNNEFEDAKTLYRQLLEISPNHKEALNNYLVLMTYEAPEDALLQLQKLERVSPYYSPIPAQIGMVYYRSGQYVQAERYLRKAITMAPDNLSYLYNLAIVSDHLSKNDQSIALYSRLLDEYKQGKTIPGPAQKITERLKYLRGLAE